MIDAADGARQQALPPPFEPCQTMLRLPIFVDLLIVCCAGCPAHSRAPTDQHACVERRGGCGRRRPACAAPTGGIGDLLYVVAPRAQPALWLAEAAIASGLGHVRGIDWRRLPSVLSMRTVSCPFGLTAW